jgi:O-antigen/teichoic acid export membrane protein
MFLVSFFGMVLGVALFSVYYRHYHSKDARANIKYTTLFAAVVAVASSLVFYQVYLFGEGSLTGSGLPWLFGALRAICLTVSAPAVAYVIGKSKRRR